jgi:DNA-binding MarR family transcriptional regulator
MRGSSLLRPESQSGDARSRESHRTRKDPSVDNLDVYIVHLVVLLCKHERVSTSERAGFELPLLLVGAFRSLIDELHQALAESGHGEARPLHGFALQAIGPDGTTTSELGRQLGVSKQAAAKTVTSLERAGYVRREPDPGDGRAVRLLRTARGGEMLALSAVFFDTYSARLTDALGPRRLAELEDVLEQMAAPIRDHLRGVPGWLS